jgi:hypothetical protein
MAIEWWYALAALLILIGMLGTVLPLLPGVPLVFAGMLLAAWAGGFQQIGGVTIVLLAILTALALLADLLASAFGTRVARASGWAFAGATLGAVVGVFFGIVGLLLGPFLGAIGGELFASQNLPRAASAGFGAVLGLLLGAVAKVALAFTMLGLFVFALVL